MRVYTRVVIDIDTGAVLCAEAFDHHGPVAWCKGGGSQTINSYDPEYNAGLLSIQKEQQEFASMFVNLFMHGVTYDPTEEVTGMWYTDPETGEKKWVNEEDITPEMTGGEQWIQNPETQPGGSAGQWVDNPGTMGYDQNGNWTNIGGGREWVPDPDAPTMILNPNYTGEIQTITQGELQGYDPNAQTSEMELYQMGIEAAAGLLPLQTQLAETQIGADLQLIPAQTGLQLTQIEAEQGLVPLRADLEEAQINSEQTLIPLRTDLEQAQLTTETGLVPKRGELEGAQIDMAMNLLPQQERLASTQINDTITGINQRAPVRQQFYQQALNGVNVKQREDQAAADVELAFGQAEKNYERGIFASGLKLNPNDAAYQDAKNKRELSKASGIAGARTQARRLAEDEMFNRLKSAMSS